MIRKTKQYFRNLSIRRKLNIINMIITVIALFLAYTAFIVYDITAFKKSMVINISTLAEMIGANSSAAITFDNAKDATETLATLAAEKDIEAVAVYTREGHLFAQYQQENRIASPFPINPGRSRWWFAGEHLFLFQKILLNDEDIGTVYMQSSLHKLSSRIKRHVAIATPFALFSLIIAFLIAAKFQTLISKPIMSLATVAQKVTANRDYTIRAPESGKDEVGLLISGFNDMLSQIQIRDTELQRAHGELEVRAVELQNELSERKKAQKEMAKMREFLQNVIDSMPSILVAVDKHGRVTQWNAEAEKYTGLSKKDAENQPLEAMFPKLKEQMETIHEAILHQRLEKRERISIGSQGDGRFSDIMVYPLVSNGVQGAVIRVDDVTERVRMEEMMAQTEKMMSVGGLAAGMAHEINNPLGIIVQNVQNVVRRISPDVKKNVEVADRIQTSLDTIHKYMEERDILTFLDDIHDAGKRASTIVTNMLNFSRRSESERSTNDLTDLLDRAVELAANDYDLKKKYDFRHIEIQRDYDPNLPKVPCISSKMEQVFLNLLKNAAQALGEGNRQDSPRIRLCIRREGDTACIEIEDNGPGMTEEIRKRIFEPFYTTKEVGTGTGLGLSVSYFLITENHKGTIKVESSVGKGTKFIIQLPLNPV
ncbi:PAS domain S-box protein [bacterium]|nr:PAS domain S-box protein [bacterium]